MKLQEVLQKVREEDLGREDLENYHLALSNLFGEIKREMASLKKERALFMAGKAPEESVACRKVYWDATPSGQRLFELEGDASATKIMIDSVKSRLYSIY
jgi:hypothetical protein